MLRLTRVTRQYFSRTRETHLKRVGMDRDNYLEGVKPGWGFALFAAAFCGLYQIKMYTEYIVNLEHRWCRLPIATRLQHLDALKRATGGVGFVGGFGAGKSGFLSRPNFLP